MIGCNWSHEKIHNTGCGCSFSLLTKTLKSLKQSSKRMLKKAQSLSFLPIPKLKHNQQNSKSKETSLNYNKQIIKVIETVQSPSRSFPRNPENNNQPSKATTTTKTAMIHSYRNINKTLPFQRETKIIFPHFLVVFVYFFAIPLDSLTFHSNTNSSTHLPILSWRQKQYRKHIKHNNKGTEQNFLIGIFMELEYFFVGDFGRITWLLWIEGNRELWILG